MGHGGQTYGIALYEEPGSIARVAEAVDEGRKADAARIPVLGVTLDDTPRFAVEALHAAFDLPVVPVPMKVRGGRPEPLAEHEIVLLAAAMGAAAELNPAKREATVGLSFGDRLVSVAIRAPEVEG
jgi:hypothetical protein